MAEYIRRRTTSNMLYDIYEDVVRNILADGKPVHPSLVKNIMLRFEKAINLVPAADVVEVVHGEWVRYEHGSGIYCSHCRHKRRYRDAHDNYCPNCGADMRRDTNG